MGAGFRFAGSTMTRVSIGASMKILNSSETKKVYAIRVGNIVEIRVSSRPIRKLVSSLTQLVEKDKYEYEQPKDPNGYPMMVIRKVKVPFVMKQVYFVGGTLIGSIKSPNFERAMGMLKVLPKDTPVELNREQSEKILAYDWEKRV